MFSGEEGTTDNSILYDYDGIPFVSGTTLAGAFRNYYNLEKIKIVYLDFLIQIMVLAR